MRLSADDRLQLLAAWAAPVEEGCAGVFLDEAAMRALLAKRVRLQEVSLQVLKAVRERAPTLFALLDAKGVFDRLWEQLLL